MFAGIGGFRLAMEHCGGNCIGFSEINTDAIQTYVANHSTSKDSNFGDITKLKDLPPHDLLTGGVPCQSWSIAGRNLGFDDDRGQLWNDAIFLLNKSRPKAFIFENVKGLVDPRNKKALDYILSRIRDAGYFADVHVINSFDYGVPQSRVRIYIIGFREERFFKAFMLPKPVEKKLRLKDILDDAETMHDDTYTAIVEDEKDFFGVVLKKSKGSTSLSTNNNGFNDYFLFNDLRNGFTTIHSWDILETTKRQKHICMILLRNRRKRKYGILDGNPLALHHFEELDPKITQSDLDGLVEIGILKAEDYSYSVTGDREIALTEDEKNILSKQEDGKIIPDKLGLDRSLKVKNIKFAPVLESLQNKGLIHCDEVRYDFKNTKISTGLFGVNRIFLPCSNIFPTLVASDSNDYVTHLSIQAVDEREYRAQFLEKVFEAKKYRRITKTEACRIQGFPSDFSLPESRARWMKLIGNSVSVPVVEMLVRAICATGVFEECKAPITKKTEHKEDCKEPCGLFGKSVSNKYVHYDSTMEQLTLFESQSLYVVLKSPVTLLGTYRKTCLDWIVKNKLYNYPVTDDEMDSHYELLAVRRLILKRQKDSPLYFAVSGYSIVSREELKALGYPVNSNHHARTKYILYKLEKLEEVIPEFKQEDAYIVGKGLKQESHMKVHEIQYPHTRRFTSIP